MRVRQVVMIGVSLSKRNRLDNQTNSLAEKPAKLFLLNQCFLSGFSLGFIVFKHELKITMCFVVIYIRW